MKQTANVGIGIILLLGLAGLPAGAQSQAPSNSQPGQSLGDYARQVRKDPDASKTKPHVFDNDNLPKTDKLSVVGTASTNAEPAPEQKPADANAATPAGAEGKPAAAAATPPADTSKMDEAAKQAAFKQW